MSNHSDDVVDDVLVNYDYDGNDVDATYDVFYDHDIHLSSKKFE